MNADQRGLKNGSLSAFIPVHPRLEMGSSAASLGVIAGTILMLVVAHVYREEAGGQVVRIISARRALAWERRLYDEANA